MNSLDDVLANRVVSLAKCTTDGAVLLVLDGGEALWLYGVQEPTAVHVHWRYVTGPHLRELLGLGAPPRPRPGHAMDQEALEAVDRPSDAFAARVIPRADPFVPGTVPQCRVVGHMSPLVPDGVYERVSD